MLVRIALAFALAGLCAGLVYGVDSIDRVDVVSPETEYRISLADDLSYKPTNLMLGNSYNEPVYGCTRSVVTEAIGRLFNDVRGGAVDASVAHFVFGAYVSSGICIELTEEVYSFTIVGVRDFVLRTRQPDAGHWNPREVIGILELNIAGAPRKIPKQLFMLRLFPGRIA